MTDIFEKLAPGDYIVDDEGRVVKKSDIGKALILQGVATEFDKPFAHGDKDGHKVVTLGSGCMDAALRSGGDVKLLIDHDEKHCLGSWKDRLLIHAGKKHLVFRFLIPESNRYTFSDVADDFETYLPCSIGYDILKADN